MDQRSEKFEATEISSNVTTLFDWWGLGSGAMNIIMRKIRRANYVDHR